MEGILRGLESRRISDAEVAQDLGADAVGARVPIWPWARCVPVRRVRMASPSSGRCISTMTPWPCWPAQPAPGRWRRTGACWPGREIEHRQRFMHARPGFAAGRMVPLTQRQMAPLAWSTKACSVDSPWAVGWLAGHALLTRVSDEGAVVDQVGDGADLDAMPWRTRSAPGRRAMVPSSFMISQITEAVPAGPYREVATGFGVAGADQHAAFAGGDREDVAGLHDVVGDWRSWRRRPGWSWRGRRRKCRW